MTFPMAALRAESEQKSEGGMISTSNSGWRECLTTNAIVELPVSEESEELSVSVESWVSSTFGMGHLGQMT